jgi:glutaredoxin
LTAEQRKRNVASALQLDPGRGNVVKGKAVVLLDDVIAARHYSRDVRASAEAWRKGARERVGACPCSRTCGFPGLNADLRAIAANPSYDEDKMSAWPEATRRNGAHGHKIVLCGFCHAAKDLAHAEIDVSADADLRREMVQRAFGMCTALQIFINDRRMGGLTELAALRRDNELEAWLPGASNALPADTLPDITER